MKTPFQIITIGDGAHETPKWSAVLDVDFSRPTPYKGIHLGFFKGNQMLGELKPNGELVTKARYACDGYTPCFRLFGKWIRITPTPKAGFVPAFRHDLTRQFLDVEGCPWTRKDSDDWFHQDLIEGGEPKWKTNIYHRAVSGIAGNVWIAISRKIDPELKIKLL